MGAKDYWKSGSWNAICAVCGFKFKADELKLRWDGFYVCDKDWEPRHVLDFFTVREEDPSVPWVQKEDFVYTPNISSASPVDTGITIGAAQLETLTYSLIVSITGAGTLSISLPAIASLPSYVSRLNIATLTGSTSYVILQANGGDTIQGTATVTPGTFTQFIINGTQWVRT